MGVLLDLFSNAACTDIKKCGWISLSIGNYLDLWLALGSGFLEQP